MINVLIVIGAIILLIALSFLAFSVYLFLKDNFFYSWDESVKTNDGQTQELVLPVSESIVKRYLISYYRLNLLCFRERVFLPFIVKTIGDHVSIYYSDEDVDLIQMSDLISFFVLYELTKRKKLVVFFKYLLIIIYILLMIFASLLFVHFGWLWRLIIIGHLLILIPKFVSLYKRVIIVRFFSIFLIHNNFDTSKVKLLKKFISKDYRTVKHYQRNKKFYARIEKKLSTMVVNKQ